MTHAFYSDAAEKARIELTRDERAAVDRVRAALEADPRQGHPMPDSDLQVVDLLPEETGGRGISVVYRYSGELDAVLVLWLVAGP
ncbi:hypothetical protein I5Q34_26785 [Streptomyces sp. AV19]|uniref:hypothetical protein n=1 Tax=Streptomyces sp. AV19 TaxID=2793068 RepID=UPI0018FEAA95|nr:hypothetical protein [Streptomyces sp. AV19]MBH1937833.1 hypothetical protein [Streptomyces sp. AV19]MDG4537111.1 hypothetical protein [Streptomyces sp. AV19]